MQCKIERHYLGLCLKYRFGGTRQVNGVRGAAREPLFRQLVQDVEELYEVGTVAGTEGPAQHQNILWENKQC